MHLLHLYLREMGVPALHSLPCPGSTFMVCGWNALAAPPPQEDGLTCLAKSTPRPWSMVTICEQTALNATPPCIAPCPGSTDMVCGWNALAASLPQGDGLPCLAKSTPRPWSMVMVCGWTALAALPPQGDGLPCLA